MKPKKQKGVYSPSLVKLVCRKCKQTRKAFRDKTDPPGTYEIHMDCPDCTGEGFDDLEYRGKDGSAITPESEVAK